MSDLPKTVFVLGAGASKEVNMPLGHELTKAIGTLVDIRFEHGYKKISGDAAVTDALRVYAARTSPRNPDINPFLHAGWRIRDALSLAASIDTFLDGHRDDQQLEMIGKLAITQAILNAERHSGLYSDLTKGAGEPVDLDRVKATWYGAFWRVLCNGCTAEELLTRGRAVSFISFNYDRCIEQFLHHAARAYYGLTSEAATSVVKSMRVLHPYGSIGPLPWQQSAAAKSVAYGAEVNGTRLLELAAGIKTFAESVKVQNDVVASIRACLDAADRVVFLGFAYHPQNLRLLWPQRITTRDATRRVYGTAFQISPSDVSVIVRDIADYSGIHHGTVTLRPDLTCSKLFHEYQHSLSMTVRA